MKKIGNIVTNGRKTVYNEVFNVVNSIDDCIPELPTLVVGWSNMKSMFPEATTTEKSYNGINWTFTKTERRCDYEEDITRFYRDSLKASLANVKYVYVDIINYSLSRIKKAIFFARYDTDKTVFLTRGSNFMFVYSKRYNTVFGLSLTLCEYLGIPKRKAIALFRGSEFVHDTSFIDSELRAVIGGDTHYILPLYEYFRKV